MTIEAVQRARAVQRVRRHRDYGNCAVTDAHDPLELRLTTQGHPLPACRSAWWTRRPAGRSRRARSVSFA